MRLLDLQGLRAKGIKFSIQHINRLEGQGKFPNHVKVGDRSNAWIEREIDDYIEGRIAQRDALKTA